MISVEGKVVLITGGASGIGEGMVRRFTAEGARVVFSDISEDAGRALAAETDAEFHVHDVALAADWDRVMAAVHARHGRLDGLMNNAGRTGGGSIEATELEVWNRIIAVNLTGVMLGCQAGIKAMRANPGAPGGSIVNTSSTTAHVALGHDAAYSSTKGAVSSLTRSVAVYCGKAGYNIRCNSIAPGPTDTAILRRHAAANPSALERFEGMTVLGRLGTPDDLAATAVFLVSDDSAFITGSSFAVDGGTMAGHPGF